MKLTPAAADAGGHVEDLDGAEPVRTGCRSAYEASVVLIKRRRAARAAPPVRVGGGVRASRCARPGDRSGRAAGGDRRRPAGPHRPQPARATTRACASRPATRSPPKTTDRATARSSSRRSRPGCARGRTSSYVVHDVHATAGEPPAPHRGFESNAGLFTLIPKIKTKLTDAQGDADRDRRAGPTSTSSSRPPSGRTQRVALVLGGPRARRACPARPTAADPRRRPADGSASRPTSPTGPAADPGARGRRRERARARDRRVGPAVQPVHRRRR